ncbi:MAG: efflux RND transporter periplasmic adaptor subunit [Pseudomonadota bacterium]
MSETPSIGSRVRRVALWGTVFSVNLAIAGGALILGTGYLYSQAAGVERIEALPAPIVETFQAELVTAYAVERRYAGRIEAARTTELAFETGGTVETILVEEGDTVEEGEVIATLDTRLLEASLTEQRAAREALVAQQEFARVTVNRRQELQGRGFTSQEAFDDARFSLARLTAEIARVDAALSSIEIQLEKTVLRAPFTATVGARQIDEGTAIAGGRAVVSLLEATAPQLRIGLPPEAAARLTPADRYTVDVDGQMLTATLDNIRPDLDPATRTVAVLFTLEDSNGALPFGQIAELVLSEEVSAQGYWVPVAALQEGIRGLWTVMVVRDGSVEREAVEVLHVAGGEAFVRGALGDGAPIVSSGTHRISPGQSVRLES